MVTSVPSDAPDDYAALRDLQKKPVSVELLLHSHWRFEGELTSGACSPGKFLSA